MSEPGSSGGLEPEAGSGAHDTFASDWLALREPVDHRSRSSDLVRRLDTVGASRGWSRILDLGTGRGSNLRYLAPRLGWARAWTAVDHDGALLDELRASFGADVTTVEGDLRAEGLDRIADADVVTASALLDLVSAEWVEAMAERCAVSGCAVLVALTWDGSFEWREPDPDDARVLDAVRRHQAGEKGMGRALGPSAAVATTVALRNVGFDVGLEASPWVLRGPDAALARALMDGWVEAAQEMLPNDRERLVAWRDRRRAHIDGGAWELRVGHHDLLGLPPEGAT